MMSIALAFLTLNLAAPQVAEPIYEPTRLNREALAGRTFRITGERLADLEATERRTHMREMAIVADAAAADAARAAGEASDAPATNPPIIDQSEMESTCLEIRSLQSRIDIALVSFLDGRELIAPLTNVDPALAEAYQAMSDTRPLTEATQIIEALGKRFCPMS